MLCNAALRLRAWKHSLLSGLLQTCIWANGPGTWPCPLAIHFRLAVWLLFARGSMQTNACNQPSFKIFTMSHNFIAEQEARQPNPVALSLAYLCIPPHSASCNTCLFVCMHISKYVSAPRQNITSTSCSRWWPLWVQVECLCYSWWKEKHHQRKLHSVKIILGI